MSPIVCGGIGIVQTVNSQQSTVNSQQSTVNNHKNNVLLTKKGKLRYCTDNSWNSIDGDKNFWE
ncbi:MULTISPECIES: hypothetical protein [unclassified Microcoleus]|uniref:hypothetical protein n=1 Tax=unclassified Microcoleus TaxID=2642155 RepID=UPI002FD5F3EF